jgi:ribosomal protein S18 acetylase RimI-like enzyme
MQASVNEIRFLEEISLNALPSLQTVVYDGWLLRFAGGHTNRANSVQALDPCRLPLVQKIAYCEAAYHSQGLLPRFKLTDAAHPPELDAELASRGYRIHDAVSVQVAPVSTESDGSVEIEERPSEGWIDAFCRLSRLAPGRRETFTQMVGSIVPAAGFASRRVHGEIVSMGMGVVERGWVGLFDIVTAEEHRRQGHGAAVVTALSVWSRAHGAERAYLQVTQANAPALALYAKLGFREAYTYWYRAKDD